MSRNYRITENVEAEEIVIPKRIQTLIGLYQKAGNDIEGEGGKKYECRYEWETIDLHLKLFEDKLRLASKPNSLKYMITAIYRILHNEKESYMYNQTRTFSNKLSNPEILSEEGIGHYLAPVIGMRFNEQKGVNLPEVVKYEHYFDQPWNPKEVKRLLESSTVPCIDFYIGNANPIVTSEPITNPYFKIENKEDFLTGSYEDLITLGRLGISEKEPSLYLLPAALKRAKDNREKNLRLDRQGLYT